MSCKRTVGSYSGTILAVALTNRLLGLMLSFVAVGGFHCGLNGLAPLSVLLLFDIGRALDFDSLVI